MMPLRNVLSQIELRASLAVMGIVQLVVPFLGETESDTTHTHDKLGSQKSLHTCTYMQKRQHIHLPISSSIITLSQMIAKKEVPGNSILSTLGVYSTNKTKWLATTLPTLTERTTVYMYLHLFTSLPFSLYVYTDQYSIYLPSTIYHLPSTVHVQSTLHTLYTLPTLYTVTSI